MAAPLQHRNFRAERDYLWRAVTDAEQLARTTGDPRGLASMLKGRLNGFKPVLTDKQAAPHIAELLKRDCNYLWSRLMRAEALLATAAWHSAFASVASHLRRTIETFEPTLPNTRQRFELIRAPAEAGPTTDETEAP